MSTYQEAIYPRVCHPTIKLDPQGYEQEMRVIIRLVQRPRVIPKQNGGQGWSPILYLAITSNCARRSFRHRIGRP